MFEEIKDINGKLICKGDPSTGAIESISSGMMNRTHLYVGQNFEIEKNGAFTIITRKSSEEFEIKRYTSKTE